MVLLWAFAGARLGVKNSMTGNVDPGAKLSREGSLRIAERSEWENYLLARLHDGVAANVPDRPRSGALQ